MATGENVLSAEMDDILTGGDLVIVGDGKVQGSGLLQEGDLVVKHLRDLDSVGTQDLDQGGLGLKLGLDGGVCDGGGGVRHGQPPVNCLIPDYRLDAFLKQTQTLNSENKTFLKFLSLLTDVSQDQEIFHNVNFENVRTWQ